jgi:hypothetical protein
VTAPRTAPGQTTCPATDLVTGPAVCNLPHAHDPQRHTAGGGHGWWGAFGQLSGPRTGQATGSTT